MKKYLITLILIQISLGALAQSLGDITLNENFSATCEFSNNIKNIHISNNELIQTVQTYDGKIEERIERFYDFTIYENTVVFTAVKQVPSKSITIILDDNSTWYGIINYDIASRKIYYPFTDNNEASSNLKKSKKKSLINIEDRLQHCIINKSHFIPFGINKNGIYWEVSNIMADEEYMYLKIIVENKSGHIFEILNGRPLFRYEEGKSRNLKRKEASVNVDGVIKHNTGVDKISGYSSETLGYVINNYPLNRKGKLIVSFIEADGKRNYDIQIPFKYLEKIDVFYE